VIIHIHNPSNPDTNAKPKGIKGTEFYMHIGNDPPPQTEWIHAGSTGRFLFTLNFPETGLGKTIHIVARYRNNRNEFGPYSVPVKLIIS